MKHTTLTSHDQGKKSGQMMCPNCSEAIPVTFHALLVEGKLICKNPSCKTVLQLNRAQSQTAISSMKKLQAGLKEIS